MKETGIRVSKGEAGLADRRIILWQRPSGPSPPVTVLHGVRITEIPWLAMDLPEVSISNPSHQLLMLAPVGSGRPATCSTSSCREGKPPGEPHKKIPGMSPGICWRTLSTAIAGPTRAWLADSDRSSRRWGKARVAAVERGGSIHRGERETVGGGHAPKIKSERCPDRRHWRIPGCPAIP